MWAPLEAESGTELNIVEIFIIYLKKCLGENTCGREENDNRENREKLHCDKGPIISLANPIGSPGVRVFF